MPSSLEGLASYPADKEKTITKKYCQNNEEFYLLTDLGKYFDLYLRADVILLADISGNFKKRCFWRNVKILKVRVKAFLFLQKIFSNIFWKIHLVINGVNSKSQVDEVDMVEFSYGRESIARTLIEQKKILSEER